MEIKVDISEVEQAFAEAFGILDERTDDVKRLSKIIETLQERHATMEDRITELQSAVSSMQTDEINGHRGFWKSIAASLGCAKKEQASDWDDNLKETDIQVDS